MIKKFKSSVSVLVRSFIVNTLVIAFIILALLVGIGMVLLEYSRQDILSVPFLITGAIIALALGGYLAFVRHNSTVEVYPDRVDLYRGKKIYAVLKSEKYHFTSFIQRTMSQAGIYTSRYLRVIDKKNGKQKDYRLYFSKKHLQNLMATLEAAYAPKPEAETVEKPQQAVS